MAKSIFLMIMLAAGCFGQLNQNCTISVLNRNVQVNPDGTWVLPNIPANQGRVRARATCMLNGLTRFGQSDLFDVPQNGAITLQPIIFGVISPIPAALNVKPSAATINQLGGTSQIKAVATYPDGKITDVSKATAGTNYTSSDTTVATISTDGLVKAVSNGVVLITAFNEGTSGSASVQIGIPPQITITSPSAGTSVTQGATIPVTAEIKGGAAVAAVSFTVNGRIEYTAVTSPFVFQFTVPTGVTSVTLGASVRDVSGATATAQSVVIMATADPLTTVTGSVVDQGGSAISGAMVSCVGVAGATGVSGAFSIANVPTARGNIVCFASAVVNGATYSGSSASAVPVAAGITNVGKISLAALSSRGTDFWLATQLNPYYYEAGTQLFVLAESSASFTVTGPNGFSVKGTVNAQNPAVVALPADFETFQFNTVIQYGVHLTSDAPVTATLFYPGSQFYSSSYLSVPTALLGTEYYALTETYYPQFTIVGAVNNTKVTFTPSCASYLGDIAANTPITIALNQGDTYNYLCYDGTLIDGSGSHVVSDKPVGFIAGNYFAYLNNSYTNFGFISEMMFPIASLYGTDFYSAPVSNVGADSVKLIAARDGTTVKVSDGANTTSYVLNHGEFKEIAAAKPAHYSSDKPISVVQFGSNPNAYLNAYYYGLTAMQMIPTSAFRTSSRFYSPAGFDKGNFATIIAPNSSVDGISINGVAVNGFLPLPGGSYSYVTVPVSVGQSVVTSTQPVAVYATGFSAFGAYGNPTTF